MIDHLKKCCFKDVHCFQRSKWKDKQKIDKARNVTKHLHVYFPMINVRTLCPVTINQMCKIIPLCKSTVFRVSDVVHGYSVQSELSKFYIE